MCRASGDPLHFTPELCSMTRACKAGGALKRMFRVPLFQMVILCALIQQSFALLYVNGSHIDTEAFAACFAESMIWGHLRDCSPCGQEWASWQIWMLPRPWRQPPCPLGSISRSRCGVSPPAPLYAWPPCPSRSPSSCPAALLAAGFMPQTLPSQSCCPTRLNSRFWRQPLCILAVLGRHNLPRGTN